MVNDKLRLTADDFRNQYGSAPAAETMAQQSLSGMTLDDMERQAILSAVAQYDGNMTQVAAALGISRGALYRRLEKYGISQ